MKSYIIVLLLIFQISGWADEEESISYIANEVIDSNLLVGRNKMNLKGTLGLHLQATEASLKKGVVELKDLNILLKEVNQSLLSNKKPIGKATGALGFTRDRSKPAVLKYDARSKTLTGSVNGRVDFPQLMEFAKVREAQKLDLIPTPSQAARLSFVLQLPEGLPESAESYQKKLSGQLAVKIQVSPLNQYRINGYSIGIQLRTIDITYVFLSRYELARRICIQPVGIKTSLRDLSPSGVGLSFGMPQSNLQWKKSDIYFQVRGWKYIVNTNLAIVNNSAEELQIRSTIQDDDCIEVFFIDAFSPEDTHGGGATWGGGMASSQVITSDGNANGIDFTHLAHELGHVLGLHHPGVGSPNSTWPTLTDGSSGTLMCPSGWRRDNPRVNSLENKHNVSNPLLRFIFVQRGPAPDCNTSGDCGACY